MHDFSSFAENIRSDFNEIRSQVRSVQELSHKVYQDVNEVHGRLKSFYGVSGRELYMVATNGQSVNASIQQIYHQMSVMLSSLGLPVQQSLRACGRRLDEIRAKLLNASDVYPEILLHTECKNALKCLIDQLDELCEQLADTLAKQSQLWAHLPLAKTS